VPSRGGVRGELWSRPRKQKSSGELQSNPSISSIRAAVCVNLASSGCWELDFWLLDSACYWLVLFGLVLWRITSIIMF
jgi:hypothetical protein